jgi:hypothetical protein
MRTAPDVPGERRQRDRLAMLRRDRGTRAADTID